MKKAALVLGVTGMLCALGCGTDDADAGLPEVDCSTQAVGYGEVAAFQKCVTCHSSNLQGAARKGAEGAVNFDTYEAAKPIAQEAAHKVQDGEMPPPASGVTLTDGEKEQLYRWALCGAMP